MGSDQCLFYREQKNLSRVLSHVYSVIRPYSVAYVALLGVVGVLSGQRPVSWGDALAAMVLAPCLFLGVAALNDYAHRCSDTRARRGRNHDPWLLLAMGLLGIGATAGGAALRGPETLASVLLAVLFGAFYGWFKSVPGVANLLRGAVTGAFVFAAGTMTGVRPETLAIALGAALLDAAGNVWGDIRDLEYDRRAALRTVAVVSPGGARHLAIGLHGVATCGFLYITPLAVSFLAAGIVIAAVAPPRRGHLWFLMLKYATLGSLGFHLAGSDPERALVGLLALMALPSYRVYQRQHTGS